MRAPGLSQLLSCALAAGFAVAAGCASERELREWTPEDHQPPPAGPTDRVAADEDPDPEATLFRSRCASCHGEGGRGHGVAAPPNVPDFTDAAFQADREDDALARVIADGRGLMPAFGGELTEAGIAAMVRYVRRLGRGEGDAPVSPHEAPLGPGHGVP